MYKYSVKSLDKLQTCHIDLQRLFLEAIQHRDITILDGHRDAKAQNKAYAEGKSNAQFPESKHNSLPSMAVDAAFCPINWDDKNEWMEFGGFIQGLAAGMGISIKWGGNFRWKFDGPHFELIEDIA